MSRAIPIPLRVPLALGALFALVVGITAGLARAGWGIPASGSLVLAHGPLLAVGFFGTLIGLERAVAVGHPAALALPGLAALSGGALFFDAPPMMAPLLAVGAGAAGVIVAAGFLARERSTHLIVLALGALAWLAGNALWLAGRPIADASLGWSGFLVLTIAGERLELTRFLPPRRGRDAALAIALATFAAGSLATLGDARGAIVRGVGLALVGAWLLTYDAALRVRPRGAEQGAYVRVALTAGHAWLLVAGAATMLDQSGAGLVHDAALHSLYVGFVLGMVLAHVPIVLPIVLGVRFAPSRALYVPLGVMHASVALRVLGDLAGDAGTRRLAALGHALGLALFAVTVVVILVRDRRPARAIVPPLT